MTEKQILSEILSTIKQNQSLSSELWAIEDIALFLKISPDSVSKRITKVKTFPKPIKVPTTEGTMNPRWYAQEVREWVKRHKS
ncbi:helix-turn-helix transcriptional regulator [Kiloniella sp. b19]|uniref:helix-turn-helix transcriptional regulator n=1 Tax=Kiloniella sp. GXU_MW_B19 TaxID=3141326 RepID=UPI0031DDDA30